MCISKQVQNPIYGSKSIELFDKYWNDKSRDNKFECITANPDAIPLLIKHRVSVDWDIASGNSGAIQLLKKNRDKINYYKLSSNTGAYELIKAKADIETKNKFDRPLRIMRKDKRYLDWDRLSENPAAIELLKANPDKINWYFICKNPAAIQMIREELKKPRCECKIKKWNLVASNPAAIDLILDMIKTDPYLINWDYIFSNPSAIPIIRFIYKNYPEQINWPCLYENPAAIDIIESHLKTNANNHTLKQLGCYNYWNVYTRKYHHEALGIFAKSNSWKSDIKALFDRTNKQQRARLDLKKYQIIREFESIQELLYKKYDVYDSEQLIKRMMRNPKIAKEVLNKDNRDDPIRTFEEMKMRRNILAHESEMSASNVPYNSFDMSPEEIDNLKNYRTLKHFKFVQTKLMIELPHLYSWKTNMIISQTNWNSKHARTLLGHNPRGQYIKLKTERNKIAHLIGESVQ